MRIKMVDPQLELMRDAAPELYAALKDCRDVLAVCRDDVAGTPTEKFFSRKVRFCDLVLAKAEGKV